ncbi:related to rhomboid family protein [Ramularia collo-cygni]|uniref:Related to rhomboid family protein n=1 Tax=Ramularia collo-cygni TaxID=112498 RepID=A0A2D3VGN2_9PEZI|nr:related to rhomboid family protein [Ramularia collo-cygni]CZT24412.1 related to rhomboid family protein [Ramularia collo-cygni]
MPRIALPPPLTRGLLLVLVSLSALNAVLRTNNWRNSTASTAPTTADYLSSPRWAIPYLVLIPTKSIRYPWTALTGAVVENNIVSICISAVVVFYGGRYLERALGTKEFGKFVIFVTLLPSVMTFLIYALWHALTPPPEFPTPINGLVALEAGFLVCLKQLVPEHTVSLFKGLIRMRIKHFPAAFVIANMLSGPLLGTDTALWLSLFGFTTSWVYLRFFRISEISSAATGGEATIMKGDASDTFAFVAFFPDAVHPLLAPICDAIYNTLVELRLCTPFSEENINAGNENAASRSEAGLPNIMNGRGGGGGRRADAERRRALALKALDQRLNATAPSRGVNPPITNVQATLNTDPPSGSKVKEDAAEETVSAT